MITLPDFRLETHFSRWEFKARYHMTASDAESITLRELLAMADPEEREEFEGMSLGYTETFGAPDLLETIAATYANRKASEILCFAGASEGIFAANTVILDKDSHGIVVTPNYQSRKQLLTKVRSLWSSKDATCRWFTAPVPGLKSPGNPGDKIAAQG